MRANTWTEPSSYPRCALYVRNSLFGGEPGGGSTRFVEIDTGAPDGQALLSNVLPRGEPHSVNNYTQDRFSALPLFSGVRDTSLPLPVNGQAFPYPVELEVASPSQRLSSFMHKSRSLVRQVVCQAKEEITSLTMNGGSFTSPQATDHGSNAAKVHLADPLVNVSYYNGNKDICMRWVTTSRVYSVTPNICSCTHMKKAPLWAG